MNNSDRIYVLKGCRRENGAATVIDTFDNEAEFLRWKERMSIDHPLWMFWLEVFEGEKEAFDEQEKKTKERHFHAQKG